MSAILEAMIKEAATKNFGAVIVLTQLGKRNKTLCVEVCSSLLMTMSEGSAVWLAFKDLADQNEDTLDAELRKWLDWVGDSQSSSRSLLQYVRNAGVNC